MRRSGQSSGLARVHTGVGSLKAREVVRKHVNHFEVDRPLYNNHNKMKALVKSWEILVEVEKATGSLG
jgi:histidine ammonia-lyase